MATSPNHLPYGKPSAQKSRRKPDTLPIYMSLPTQLKADLKRYAKLWGTTQTALACEYIQEGLDRDLREEEEENDDLVYFSGILLFQGM